MTQDDTNKPMTLDRLARMVADGFAEMGGQMKSLATKEDLSKVDQRLGKVEYRVDELHDILKRFEEGDILDLQKRIKILERAVKALGRHIQ